MSELAAFAARHRANQKETAGRLDEVRDALADYGDEPEVDEERAGTRRRLREEYARLAHEVDVHARSAAALEAELAPEIPAESEPVKKAQPVKKAAKKA